jgi:hypothetical protein
MSDLLKIRERMIADARLVRRLANAKRKAITRKIEELDDEQYEHLLSLTGDTSTGDSGYWEDVMPPEIDLVDIIRESFPTARELRRMQKSEERLNEALAKVKA